MKTKKYCLLIFIAAIMISVIPDTAFAQSNSHYMRIAKLIIDSTRLESYKAALKEHAETAVRVEPGVLSLYAVYEKKNPTHVSVFEIYADEEAYKSHIQTAHFKKYKETVQNMVT